uniref:Putative secreted protein n=1 Tax=Anopheles darlingi TaxID=43151 RepID=A0A2M4DGE6_ANODA
MVPGRPCAMCAVCNVCVCASASVGFGMQFMRIENQIYSIPYNSYIIASLFLATFSSLQRAKVVGGWGGEGRLLFSCAPV